MKKINNLTYLDVTEIFNEMNEFPEVIIKVGGELSNDVVLQLLEEGKIKGQKIDEEWYGSKNDVSFFINSCKDEETYSKAGYGGAVGIELSDTRLDGRILDIGGGGEGIIGQLKGDLVVAIDPSRRELEEAPDGGLKVEMDGKDLKFLDNTFDTATSFFTFMYIPNTDHKKVFEEIYRVLKNNGEFVLWDINIPEYKDNDKLYYIVYLEVGIPEKTIETGYGTRWTNKEQDMMHFKNLGESVGFEVIETNELGESAFSIRFIKK